MRELEEEVEALQAGRAHRAKLMALMEKKALVGDLFNQLRLARAPPAHLQPDSSWTAGACCHCKHENRLCECLVLFSAALLRIFA